MAYPKEATVKTYKNIECWRTWFLEVCDQNHLFGVTEKYIPLINTEGFKPYRIGTLIYLEDAPYFMKTKRHKICGPYQVIESHPQGEYNIVRQERGKIIIYEELSPSKGPWLNNNSVTKTIEGMEYKFKQLASEFNFYPYRFAIKRSKSYEVLTIPHSSYSCELCFND